MSSAPSLINLFSPYNIVVFMLVMTRITGMFISAPFFSSINMPNMTKIWFCALIAFIFYPLVVHSKSFIIPHGMPEFIILMLCEFFIGYVIGFMANLIIEAIRIAGNTLSIQMSLSIAEALDPTSGTSTNMISSLYIYLALIIFISTGAHQYLFTVIFNSFQAVPMGVFVPVDTNVVSAVVQLFSQLFKIAFGLALPIFSVLLICDILLGLMSKMMPQMNVYMVAIPIKIYVGLFLMLAFLSATNMFIQNIIKKYMETIMSVFT